MKYLILLIGLVCGSAHAVEQYDLTILFTNDHHGHYLQNKHKEFGMAARLTLVNQIREEVRAKGGQVLLLSGGDINTGTPESDALDAQPDFLAMNTLGYDAMAIGNHEFDKDLSVLKKQKEWANFPFLGANVLNEDGEPLFGDVLRKTVGATDKKKGLKVALVGLTTTDSKKYMSRSNKGKVIIADAIETGLQVVPEVHAEGHDLVIVVSHMGHYPEANHGRKAPGDVTLAQQLEPGLVDFIIGGHSQVPLFQPDEVNGTTIVQAHEWGKYVGRLDIRVVKDGGERTIEVVHHELLPVNLRPVNGQKTNLIFSESGEETGGRIKESTGITSWINDFLPKAEEKLSKDLGMEIRLKQVIAEIDADFWGRPLIKYNKHKDETYLGKLISEAYCKATSSQVCFTASGGLRQDLEKGDVTMGDVLSIMPFRNNVCLVELDPSDFRKLIASMFKNGAQGSGLHFHGLRLEFSSNGSRIKKYRHFVRRSPLGEKRVQVASDCFNMRSSVFDPYREKIQRTEIIDVVPVLDFLMEKKQISAERYRKAWTVPEVFH